MSKKNHNTSVYRTITQINSTLNLLYNKALLVAYNEVPKCKHIQKNHQITWYNHTPSRINTGKSFNKLAQYKNILETNSYHGLLFDGSLIRVNFEFENDILLTQNLLWWPAPCDFSDLINDFPPLDILSDLYGNEKWFESIIMRSPIRIDFDSNNNSDTHPRCHMHIQNAETRLFIENPICFNKFICFILKNFYPNYTINFINEDFINYKTPKSKVILYNLSKVII